MSNNVLILLLGLESSFESSEVRKKHWLKNEPNIDFVVVEKQCEIQKEFFLNVKYVCKKMTPMLHSKHNLTLSNLSQIYKVPYTS